MNLCYILVKAAWDGGAMDLLDRKKRHLESLKKKIAKHKREDSFSRHQISIMERKERTKNLICAGAVFEEAGILNNYDHDKALAALLKLKDTNENELTEKGEK